MGRGSILQNLKLHDRLPGIDRPGPDASVRPGAVPMMSASTPTRGSMNQRVVDFDERRRVLIEEARQLGLEGREAADYVRDMLFGHVRDVTLVTVRPKAKQGNEELQGELLRLQIQDLRERRIHEEEKRSMIGKEHIKLTPWTDEDDIEEYLLHFEKTATVAGWKRTVWSCHLLGMLTGKAKEAMAPLSPTDSADYNKVREALRLYFKVDADSYRVRFQELQRGKEENLPQCAQRLEHILTRWLEVAGKKPDDSSKVKDLFIQEKLYSMMSESTCSQVKLMRPK